MIKSMEASPEFPLGLLLGEMTVFATVALNCLVLLKGGETTWPSTSVTRHW